MRRKRRRRSQQCRAVIKEKESARASELERCSVVECYLCSVPNKLIPGRICLLDKWSLAVSVTEEVGIA
jgi:hypothetical protein